VEFVDKEFFWMDVIRFLDRACRVIEEPLKKEIWNCHMCGQCVLHSTGLTCPMNCPKNLRNGPCGGVRANGHCEVKPEMECVWVKAVRRSHRIPIFGPEINHLRPPVDWRLKDTSSWVNLVTGRDQPQIMGWREDVAEPEEPVVELSGFN
jgi:Methylene-tetrahydrofolate reductase C terminal